MDKTRRRWYDAIPRFPLPLQAGDTEPIIDLGAFIKQIYLEARYRLRLDYTQPPVLDATTGGWVAQILPKTIAE